MKKSIITLILVGFAAFTYAQQFPTYNHIYANKNLFNPSQIGIGDKIDLALIQRNTLTSFDQNPSTLYLTLSGPVVSDQMGVGLSLYNESLGISKKTGVYGSYAYRVKFGSNHHLNFGLSVGALQFSIDPDMVNVAQDDPLLDNKNFSSSAVDGSFGATYVNGNFELGLSSTQILSNAEKLSPTANFNLERNYIGTVQYRLDLNRERTMSLTPLLVARYASSELPQEAHLIFNYDDRFFAVPSYKSSGAFAATVSANVYNGFRIGYSYETMLTGVYKGNQRGGHEIMAGYSFDIRSKAFDKQQRQIDALNKQINDFERSQSVRDSLQDALLKKQGDDINKNSSDIEQNKKKINEVDEKLEDTKSELALLKKQLIDQGILREFDASEYEGNPVKGYYIVIASVKNVRYNPRAMKEEYLDKGYNKVFNTKRGWHYVYTERVDDFGTALQLLKSTRKNLKSDAWIHILK